MNIVYPAGASALADRAAFHNRLRRAGPVSRAGDGDYYLVAGFEAVKTLLEDHGRFSKVDGNQLAPMEHNYALNQDPPSFSRFRAIYNAYMSPKGVRRWADACTEIAEELLDRLEPLGSGDLLDLFGKPLPAAVTAKAVGLPEGQIERYRTWTDAFLGTMIEDPAMQMRIIEEMYAFFDEELERRRATLQASGIDRPAPDHVGTVLGDNLISLLLTTQVGGRYLTDDEIRRTVRGFFLGGVDTTGALILNTLHRLLEQPELWQAVRKDHSLIPAAIEESLRFDPPAFGMFRGTTCDFAMGETELCANSRVLYSIPSANRDPEIFEDPDTFRLDRKPVKGGINHLSFGGGAHFCPGAWTARMEAGIALRLIVERLPKLRLVGPVEHYDLINFWVVRRFPAAWD
ncbi:cytochrome P450 [Novosphingobium taihuense]|nr:cytochrome P450 [Novosphingobium taihuense]